MDWVIIALSIIYILGVLIILPDLWKRSNFEFQDKLFWTILVVGGGIFGELLYISTFTSLLKRMLRRDILA